jgi:hypothetical protein
MKIRKLGVCLTVALMIGALEASCARGAVETTSSVWVTGETPTELTGPKTITAKMIEDPGLGVVAKFKTEIGGLPVELTSTSIECSACAIEDKELTGKEGKVAFGSGKIVFMNVTAMLPENCTVKSESGVAGEVITKSLNIHGDFMDANTENNNAFVEFIPQAGAGTTFAQFKLSGTGCAAIAGTYNVTGTVFGESEKNTGENAAEQDFILGSAVQATTGSELKVGTKAATLTGRASFSIGGEAFGLRTVGVWAPNAPYAENDIVEDPRNSGSCWRALQGSFNITPGSQEPERWWVLRLRCP